MGNLSKLLLPQKDLGELNKHATISKGRPWRLDQDAFLWLHSPQRKSCCCIVSFHLLFSCFLLVLLFMYVDKWENNNQNVDIFHFFEFFFFQTFVNCQYHINMIKLIFSSKKIWSNLFLLWLLKENPFKKGKRNWNILGKRFFEQVKVPIK